nr:hypothetical protein [uncultured Campylobacter sp.]
MFVWICLRGFDLKFSFKLECEILKRGRKILKEAKILKHLRWIAGSLERYCFVLLAAADGR